MVNTPSLIVYCDHHREHGDRECKSVSKGTIYVVCPNKTAILTDHYI